MSQKQPIFFWCVGVFLTPNMRSSGYKGPLSPRKLAAGRISLSYSLVMALFFLDGS